MPNTEKIVVARPVPSRPHSSYRSFSDLLLGTLNASPVTAETSVAIKPKTLRFKPSLKLSPHEVVPSQSILSESTTCFTSDKPSATTSKTVSKSPSMYKPVAEVVTNTSSLMASMGNDACHHKTLADKQLQFQDIHPSNYIVQNLTASHPRQNSPSIIAAKEIYELPELEPMNMEQDVKAQQIDRSGDRPSYDGYNWRKYGQKQVKGSEHPRSYYKCTHPSCPVKRKVERSLDGQIAEIVYKGEHNHPKPRPPKRLVSVAEERGSECGGSLLGCDPLISGSAYNGEVGNRNSSINNDRHKSKRRKNKEQVSGEGSASQPVRADSESLMQASRESHVTGDGFRWRKYGQKVAKGNSYPRSYYRCTNLKCNVRKHIERAPDDPRSFVTTYEGKHNHNMPDKGMNSTASDSDTLSKQ